MVAHGHVFLASARDLHAISHDRAPTTYECARHAAELFAKALLLKATGDYPRRSHNVAGLLARHGLLPQELEMRDVSSLLGSHTRGRYGFLGTFTAAEVVGAIACADALARAAEAYPEGNFHLPPGDQE